MSKEMTSAQGDILDRFVGEVANSMGLKVPISEADFPRFKGAVEALPENVALAGWSQDQYIQGRQLALESIREHSESEARFKRVVLVMAGLTAIALVAGAWFWNAQVPFMPFIACLVLVYAVLFIWAGRPWKKRLEAQGS